MCVWPSGCRIDHGISEKPASFIIELKHFWGEAPCFYFGLTTLFYLGMCVSTTLAQRLTKSLSSSSTSQFWCTPRARTSGALITWGGAFPLQERTPWLNASATWTRWPECWSSTSDRWRALSSPSRARASCWSTLVRLLLSEGHGSAEESLQRVRFIICFFFLLFHPLRDKERGRESGTVQSCHLLLPWAHRHCHAIPLCFSSPVSVPIGRHKAGYELELESFADSPGFILGNGKKHNKLVVVL